MELSLPIICLLFGVGGILAIFVLYTFLGIVFIPEDKVGLVTKKFGFKSLPDDRIIAVNGEAGFQADTLNPGLHFFKFWFQYKVEKADLTVIDPRKIGVIVAKDGCRLPIGNILGRSVPCNSCQDAKAFLKNGGFKGVQLDILPPGIYRINTYLFSVTEVPAVVVQANSMGVVTTKEGAPLTKGEIAGEIIADHNNFQDPEKFLANGGKKGLQQHVILAGTYYINPEFATVEIKEMKTVDIGHVGVVVSFTGTEGVDLTGDKFQHGNIVAVGSRGVWDKPLDPGKYPLNAYLMNLEIVPTTNIVLNWATGRNESHGLDGDLSTIAVISKDGFKFSVDVSQIIHIPSKDAPQVVARFGSMRNLVSQVLEPMIANYFRNSAQTREVLEFIAERRYIQEEARDYITSILKEYNVIGVDTLIGDIVPPAEIMQTLMDKKIAEKQQDTFATQMETQKVRQELEKQHAIAELQSAVVKAERGVEIAKQESDAQIHRAEGEAKALKLRANAEAEQIEVKGKAEAVKIEAIGSANATAYEKAVKAMGQNNFALTKAMELIGTHNVRVMPDTLIMGGGQNGSSGDVGSLLSLKILEAVGQMPTVKEVVK